MAFEKAFENTYHELNLNTKYRFAEIELAKAVPLVMDLLHHHTSPRDSAISFLYNAIVPKQINFEETEEMFFRCMMATSTNKPPKIEIIHYLIIHGQSYKRIRELTSASFNTISQARYGLPMYYPNFGRWNEEMLLNWNSLKHTFNLWNEQLTHD